ncbi:MAG: Gfo/Idh/MocA family oxidoreductase, partial [Terrimicrobiaceae bacterium]
MKKSSVRLGIVGLGNMGSAHGRCILEGKVPGAELAAVCDTDKTKASLFPGVPFFEDFGSLEDSGKVDAVLIATPHYSHTAVGIAALKAGLHVLVEKPLSVHKADCERLIAAHTSRKQVFAAMFNQRTDPYYQKVRQLVHGGDLGKIRRINWIITDWFRTETYYASGGWRATWAGEGGGVVLNQCPHNLDL